MPELSVPENDLAGFSRNPVEGIAVIAR